MSRYRMVIDGKSVEVDVSETGADRYRVLVDGRPHEVVVREQSGAVAAPPAPAPAPAAPAPAPLAPVSAPAVIAAPAVAAPKAAAAAGNRAVNSPMPGRVVSVGAAAGAAVKRGTPIITIEAMKMNVPIAAPVDGTVVVVHVKVGDSVQTGQLVAEVKG